MMQNSLIYICCISFLQVSFSSIACKSIFFFSLLTWIQTDSPAVPPTAMAALICARSSGLGLRAPRVAAIPPATPIIPKALPRRAVFWLERPARAPTQHRPEPKYIIWWEKETGQKRGGVMDTDWRTTGWEISPNDLFGRSHTTSGQTNNPFGEWLADFYLVVGCFAAIPRD